MAPNEQLGANIRRRRKAAGLTQMQLSNRSGVDMGEISRIERGMRDPQLMTIVRVARGLRVPAAELLAGID